MGNSIKATKKRMLIVDDRNNGIIVNDNYTQWEHIKTDEESIAWKQATYNTLFGTYNNDTILAVIDKFNPKQGYKLDAYKNEVFKVFKNKGL